MPTLTAFLDPRPAPQVRAEHGPADLVVANNVYAHIPDVVGFTEGLRALRRRRRLGVASRCSTC